MTGARPAEGGASEICLADLLDQISSTHHEEWRRERARTTVSLMVPDEPSGSGDPAGASFVIKQLNGRYHRSGQLLSTLEQLSACEPGIAPRPLAHGTGPDYVAYEYVPGLLLDESFEDVLAAGEAGVDEARRLASEAGALLRRFHEAASSPTPEETESFDPVHFPPLLRAVSLAGTSLPPREEWIRSIADPGPHNVVVRPGGPLVLIDLPGTVQLRPRELDLGMLAQRLGRKARRSSGSLPTRRRLRLQREVAEAATAGYRLPGPVDLDERLLRACVATSAARMARKFWRRSGWSGRPDAAADAAWAVTAGLAARSGRSPG